jgi:high-affinity nickel permease
MFGLDQWMTGFSDGTTLLVVIAVAILLGLRHASDPDHLAAVTTLVAGDRGGATRLGLAWGVGHMSALVALGVPIVLWNGYLPAAVERGAELTIALVIVALAVWLLARWRRGAFADGHAHVHRRTPWQAYGIGLVHGIGGSGGVGVLLLATIGSHALALAALVLFAFFTAVSMTIVSSGFGAALGRPAFQRSFHCAAPALGVASLGFGVWYGLAALAVAPYWF